MLAFAAGQVWTYKSRDGESKSRIIVCKVESEARFGEVIHIQINGLHFRNQHIRGGFGEVIGHMPYSAEALRSSVLTLESSQQALPSFEDGYHEWCSAIDQGEAGVWTIPVAEAIAAMESVLNR